MASSDSGGSSDDSGSGDDPDQSRTTPNYRRRSDDSNATHADSAIGGTPQKQFDEQEGLSDDSANHTPAQPSKRRRLPTASPTRKAGILLFLSPIQILSSEILCLILLPAASADSSARESRGHSSRNGHSNIMTERLLTKKSRQLWSSHSTMPDQQKWGSSPVPILLLASDRSR